MAIIAADKIFIDVDDEINFVVEKILASQKERVILVVPQNALIVSSLVSMRILAKQIVKSKKLMVMVTEDEFGTKLANNAGLISTNKVSNVTPELWESAQINKEKARAEAEAVKKDLLTSRGIIESPVAQAAQGDFEDTQAENEVESDLVVVDSDVSPDDQTELQDQEKSESDEKLAKISDKDVKIKGPIQRTRRQPKLVQVAGFQVYAGGDISEVIANMPQGDTQSNNQMGDNSSGIPDRIEMARQNAQNSKDTVGGFTGRDWTDYAAGNSRKMQMPKLFKRNDIPDRTVDPTLKEKRRKKMIIGAVAAVAVLLISTYLAAFQLSSADIRITLKKAEVPVEQQLSADVAITEIDATNLVIPAKLMPDETLELSISASGNSTGEGTGGALAAGVIDIWNKTTNELTIPAGTLVENTTTNLKYVIKQEVKVPAKKANDALDIGRTEDVRIEAEKPGEEYNITESGTKSDFKIGSYATGDVIGKRFRSIEGGTTVKFKAPSQDDVNKVKTSLVENITRQGVTKIKNLVEPGYRLIDGSEKFEETAFRSTPEVGKEGDTFSVTLEGKMTALMIKETDFEQAITLLIAKNQASNTNSDTEEADTTEFQISSVGQTAITDVVRNGNKVTFKVASRGSLTSKVSVESIKQAVAGMSLAEAEEYLIKSTDIESSRINFTPGFLPGFLKIVPTDWSRIKVVLE